MSHHLRNILRLGTTLNTWQVGKTMSILVLRGRTFEKPPIFHALVGPKNTVIETCEKRLLDASYSVLLRKTILRCVAYNLKARPTPRELAHIIERALSCFPENPVLAPDDGGGMYYPEPHMGGSVPLLMKMMGRLLLKTLLLQRCRVTRRPNSNGVSTKIPRHVSQRGKTGLRPLTKLVKPLLTVHGLAKCL